MSVAGAPAAASSAAETWVELLGARAREAPADRAYTFLTDGERQAETLSHAELEVRARAVAVALRDAGACAGDRVMLLFPPGLDYIAAFFGCLFAGAVAVPAYPPEPGRLARTLPRLQGIVADAQARFVLTTQMVQSMAQLVFELAPELATLDWIAVDDVPAELARAWQAPPCHLDALAFLQYTSGSTGTPRGVMLSHRNLIANARAISEAFGIDAESSGVTWLPPYHDMGLIGGILQPLFARRPMVLMSPLDFLRRPIRWLEAISRARATISGAPNFAYDLCVRKATDEELERLDLRSWRLAFCGAEPVRAETLDRFAERFAPSGFRREAFYPCYGLAESTLLVAGGVRGLGAVVRRYASSSVEQGVPAPPTDDDAVTALVGSGRAAADHRIAVVDPETFSPCPDGRVGEIWVAGPSVANGYWRRPEETTASFGAELGAGATRWLRTGDLGFFEVGELFVTGRLKDLIIVRGRNVYPQDVELTVERAHAALRPGCGAAFAVPHDGTDWLVVVHELERRFVGERRRQTPPPDLPARAPADRREPRPDIAAFSPPADDPAPTVRLEGVVEAVCQAVSARHDLQPFAVVLLRAGTVPKTTSGKVQRYACRTAFLDGSLDVLHEWRRRLTAHSDLRGLRSVAPAPVVREPDAVSAWLAARLAKLLRLDAAKLDPASAITRYGIDSLQAVELTNLVQQVFGVSLPLERVLGGPALGELAAWICEEGATSAAPILPADAAGDDAPSFAQQRMWFLWSLEPESPSYHVAASVEVSGPLDVAALGRALDELRLRHETLRTTFHWLGDRLVARVRPWEPEPLDVRDLSGLAPVERERLRAEIVTEEPRRPFDLERGPLMRCLVLRLAEREHVVVLTLHHIVSDGWSLGVLADELSRGYRAAAGRAGGEPEPLPIQYRDFARWERELFQSGRLAPSVEYWRRRLAGAPARLELPRDRPRPPVQSHRGGRLEIALPPELGDRLHALSRAQGATLYMTLLAGFYVLMHRYTAEEDLVLGCVTAGRGRPEIERLIGFFANTLALRTDLGGDPTFRELMGRVARTTLEAYAHAALPFEHVVEVCNPERDPGRNTLVQVTFVLQNAPLPPVELEDLNLVAELDTGAARFDLLVAVWETPSGLRVSCEYATDLFEASTIHRLARHYERVLEDAVADPDARISALAPALEWQTLPIAVAATFEGRALAAALGAWLDRVHVPAHVRSIPACVSVAALLAADAELAERGAALNVICVRLEDWSPDVPEPADALAAMAREAVRFVEALAAFIRRVGTPCLVALAPPGVKWRDDAELGRRMGAVERDLAHGVARAGALWLELGAGVELYGVTRIEEADGEGAGYAPGAVAAMAACLARRIFSAGVPYRALAVDPVGLLWSEGGPPSGRGPGRVAPPLDRWQQRLGELCVGLAHRGWRLFACARGSEDELRAALRSRPELPLRARHLHGWRANDRGVADNLRDMASEAGLPLSALVYLSASATGCREVRAHCPEILVVELGPDPRENFELARHLWAWSILGDRPASEAPPLAAPAPAGGPSFAAFVERRWTGLAPPMRAEVLRRIAVELRGEAELRRALRAACAVRERRGEPIAPRDALEALIADVWSELLGVDRVGVHDDFFMLGGHSLLIARLASRLQDALGVTLPLGRAFAYRTVSDLAAGLAPTETDRRRLCRTAELVSHVAALSEADAEQELSTRRPPPA